MIKFLPVLLASLLAAGCTSYGGVARQDLPPPPEPRAHRADVGVRTIWSHSLPRLPSDSGFDLRPEVVGDTVYIASHSGQVSALRAADGVVLWQRDLRRPLSAGPAVAGDLLVIGSRDGEAIGLRASDGELLWRSGVTSEILARPAVSRDLVVVRVADGRVFGLDAATGRRLWLHEHTVPALTVRGTSSPVLAPRQLVLVGLDSGRLVALAPDSGRVLWEVAVAVPRGRTDLERLVDVDADPVLLRNDVYVSAYNGRLMAIDVASGRIRWERELSAYAGLTVAGDLLLVTDAEQRVWAFDRFTGTAVWRQDDLRGLRLTGPAAHGECVLVGDDTGHLNWLSVQDGSLLRREKIGGPFVSAPISRAGSIYLLTADRLTVLR